MYFSVIKPLYQVFTKEQNDVLAYTYPYDMMTSDDMRPIDCQTHGESATSPDTIDRALKLFNMRNPVGVIFVDEVG